MAVLKPNTTIVGFVPATTPIQGIVAGQVDISKLSDMLDVAPNNTNGTFLIWNSEIQKWEQTNFIPVLQTNTIENENIEISTYSAELNSTVSPQSIDNLILNTFSTAEYQIEIRHPSLGKQVSKVLIIYDETDVNITEYGIVCTKQRLATFTVFMSGSTITLQIQPNINSCNVKYIRHIIK